MSQGVDLLAFGGNGPNEPNFETVLRGYDKRQVDKYLKQIDLEIAALAGERDEAYAQIHALNQHVQQIAATARPGPALRRRPGIPSPTGTWATGRADPLAGRRAGRGDPGRRHRELTERRTELERGYAAETAEELRQQAKRRDELAAEVDLGAGRRGEGTHRGRCALQGRAGRVPTQWRGRRGLRQEAARRDRRPRRQGAPGSWSRQLAARPAEADRGVDEPRTEADQKIG